VSTPSPDAFDLDIEVDPAAFLPEREDDDRAGDAGTTAAVAAPAEPSSPTADDEVARGIAALEVIETELADVGRTLSRLDDGRYGTCEVCGQPIADERLATKPTATTCAAHDVSPPG
jgi:DnaK suppressor protein